MVAEVVFALSCPCSNGVCRNQVETMKMYTAMGLFILFIGTNVFKLEAEAHAAMNIPPTQQEVAKMTARIFFSKKE